MYKLNITENNGTFQCTAICGLNYATGRDRDMKQAQIKAVGGLLNIMGVHKTYVLRSESIHFKQSGRVKKVKVNSY